MTNDDDNWIGGDGGPLIVLQAGALPHWRGAADFEQSLMNGGPLETDYDLICDCDDYHMHRHGRDMLVLDDCEWVGRIFRHDHGVIVVEQCYYASEDLTDIVQQTQMAQPEISFPITVEDHRLRLLVGADDGNDANDDSYGFSEVDIEPGPKRCDVYRFDHALVITITPDQPSHPDIRRASADDAATIAAITNDAYAKYVPLMGRNPQPMNADYGQMLAEHPIWLLYVEGQPAGLIVLMHEPEALLIYSVAVHPQHQRLGLGRQLLSWAEEQARQAGYAAIRLYTNALMVENIALYGRLGYAETGREPFGEMTVVHMAKQVEG